MKLCHLLKNSDPLTLVIIEMEPHSSIGRPKPMTDEDTEMSFDWTSEIPVSYLHQNDRKEGRPDTGTLFSEYCPGKATGGFFIKVVNSKSRLRNFSFQKSVE